MVQAVSEPTLPQPMMHRCARLATDERTATGHVPTVTAGRSNKILTLKLVGHCRKLGIPLVAETAL